MSRTKIQRRSIRKQTIVLATGPKIKVEKYLQLEDIPGDYIDFDINKAIAKPNDLTFDDWTISNLIEFMERVEMLYSSCSLFCTVDTCPMFNAGPKYCFLWYEDDSSDAVQLSAPEYVQMLKRYIRRHLSNPDLFPKKGNLSPKARDILQTSYRMLFRVLAHLYICHFPNLIKSEDIKFVEIINTILAHYTNFAVLYQLVPQEEFEIFAPIYEAINRKSSQHFHCPKWGMVH